MALSDIDRKILDSVTKKYEEASPPVTGKTLRDIIIDRAKKLGNPGVRDDDLKEYLRSKKDHGFWDDNLEINRNWDDLLKSLGIKSKCDDNQDGD
ncbi:hypothetical protein, partial [Caballeronia grimmiae]|uniref:hypothetical protein n=1 Tax=Caballeronia grimmiae TaxID=1071679 RepID=UPI0038B994A6